jgi:hypothetical protein
MVGILTESGCMEQHRGLRVVPDWSREIKRRKRRFEFHCFIADLPLYKNGIPWLIEGFFCQSRMEHIQLKTSSIFNIHILLLLENGVPSVHIR